MSCQYNGAELLTIQSVRPGRHLVSIHQMAPPKRGSTHLISVYYSICRPRKDEMLSWPTVDCLPTYVVTGQPQVKRRTAKFTRGRPTFFHCAMQPLLFRKSLKNDSTQELHWLPITHRIQHNVALLKFMVHDDRCPEYLSESVQPASNNPASQRLRSASSIDFVVLWTVTKFADRAFSVAGLTVWNSLLESVRSAETLASF